MIDANNSGGAACIGVNFCKAVRFLSFPLFATCNAYFEAAFCGVSNKK